MSKQEALNQLSGQTGLQANPSLITPEANNPEVPVTPPKPDDAMKFAALAKKEAKLVREQQQMARERERLALERKTFEDSTKHYRSYEELKGKDPVQALKTLGYNETDILNFLANEQPKEMTPEERAVMAAKAEIEAFKKQQEQDAKKAQEDQNKSVINRFKINISQAIKANPEKYEYCADQGPAAEDLAFSTIEQVLKDSEGKDMMSIEEALGLVEDFYDEEYKRMASLKRNQAKPQEEAAAQTTEVEPQKTLPSQPSKTLSNKVTATVASTIQNRRETPSQKRERLMERLRQFGPAKP